MTARTGSPDSAICSTRSRAGNTASYRQAGIVLVGDAFAATCPVTGTGTDKVFTDVAQLCNVHIPAWLATEGMSEAKIASFYDDPVKKDCDAWSMAKAFSFGSVSIDTGVYWAGTALGTLLGLARRRQPVAPSQGDSHAETPRSILVILVIVVLVVIVGLTRRIVVRRMALIVP
jgi:hypothetical protein